MYHLSRDWGLIRELVVKDLKMQYSRPLFGFLWAFIVPLVTSLVFYFVFAFGLRIDIGKVPFLPYLLVALFTWRFFQDALVTATVSLHSNRALLRESGISPHLFPLSCVLSSLLNLVPGLVVMAAVSAVMMKGLPLLFLLLPVLLVLHAVMAFGLGLIASVLFLRWKDVRYVVETFLVIFFYLSPVVYSIAILKDRVPEFFFNVLMYSPFAGFLNLYRGIFIKDFFLVGQVSGFWASFLSAALFSAAVLMFGVVLYKKEHPNIPDLLSY